MAKGEKKSFLDDSTKLLLEEVMMNAVQWLLESVPEDTYEKIFQEKQKFWNMVFPFFSFILLRSTNLPGIGDDIMTGFFNELRREINRRAKEVPEEEDGKEKKAQGSSGGESFGVAYIKTESGLRRVLAERLNRLIGEEEKAALFKVNLPSKDTQQIIKNLADCDEDEFPELVSILIPKKKMKGESANKVNIVAEMAKHFTLLKRFNNLKDEEQKNMLLHLGKIPAGQVPDHLQSLAKMNDDDFREYVEAVMNKEQDRIWPQAKKIGGGVWESFKEWREEDKKKPSLADTWKAGRDRGVK